MWELSETALTGVAPKEQARIAMDERAKRLISFDGAIIVKEWKANECQWASRGWASGEEDGRMRYLGEEGSVGWI